MTEEENILYKFVNDLATNQKDMPVEFSELVNEQFWDLVDTDNEN